MADLTTVAKVKTHLGIASGDTGADTILTALVPAVSTFIGRQFARSISAADYVETFDGPDSDELTLTNQPVNTVLDPGGVTVDGNPIPKRASIGDAGWVLSNGRLKLVGYYFSAGVQNVSVSYNAGYSAVPDDIALVATVMVSDIYRGRDRFGLSSRTVPSGESLTFRADQIPGFTQWVIDSYKRVLGVAQ